MYVPLAPAQNKRAVTAWQRNPGSCKLHLHVRRSMLITWLPFVQTINKGWK